MAPVRHVRLAEARQVGRDEVEAVGQKGNEIPEHMAGAGKAVQQQQRGRPGGPGLAIKNLHPVHVGRAIIDGSHGVSLSRFDNYILS